MRRSADLHNTRYFSCGILIVLVALSTAGCASRAQRGQDAPGETPAATTPAAAHIDTALAKTQPESIQAIENRASPTAAVVPRTKPTAPCKVLPDAVEWVHISGPCRDSYAHGQGVARSVDGKRHYEGTFANGMFHGEGRYDWGSGTRYSGQFRAGRKDGSGTLVYANGSEYAGQFKDNDYEGEGSYRSANDGQYTGRFAHGKYNGAGTYLWPNGDRYTGEFVNGKMVGRGVYVKGNGDRYEGEFQDDVMQGDGVYVWANGDAYTGRFRNGKMHGNGTYRSADGSSYVGEFKDNRKHGVGKLTSGSWQATERWYRGVRVSSRAISGD